MLSVSSSSDIRTLCTNCDCPLRLGCDLGWQSEGTHRLIRFEFFRDRDGHPRCWSFVAVGGVKKRLEREASHG